MPAQSPQGDAEQLRLLLENLEDYGLFLLDPGGHVLRWGIGADRILGYQEEEVVGQPFTRFFTPDDVQRGVPEQELKTATAMGRADDNCWQVRKDGSACWVNGAITALRDEQGTLRGFAKVIRDRTQQKRLQDALADQSHLLDLAPVFACKLDGRIVIWTRGCEAMYGFPPTEAVGQDCHALLKTQFPKPRKEIEADLLQQGKWHGELTQTRQDGTAVVVSSHWLLDRDSVNGDRLVLQVQNDITDRKELERVLRQKSEELVALNRRKDEFLATLAHELRNPLAPLRNGLQILKLPGSDPHTAEQTREMMERQLQQMVRLIDDLLDVSRITRNQIILRKERVGVAVIVQSAVETSRPLIEAAGHSLSIRLPPQAVYVEADVTRLAQVFSNLLNNSARYTERGGDIRLTAEQQGSDAVVTIQDSGIGITPDVLPHIFDLFTQGDRSLERSHSGLGIGLTLVRRLVELHGGSVEASSDGQGQGSTFTVRLPAVFGAAATPSHPVGGESHCNAPARRHRIVVADDNEDAAITLSTILRQLGHEVHTALDGQAAVEAVRTFQPDIVLLDIGMPRLNGYDAARKIRELPGGGEMVLIAMTGWGQEADRRRSQQAGFDRHLVKPMDPEALQRLLAESSRRVGKP